MDKENLTENIIKNRLENTYTKQDFFLLIRKIIIIALFCFLVFTFVFSFHPLIGDSMVPNIKNTDLTVIYKLDHDYRQGDVVLISKNGTSYILRIIGVPGNTISFSEIGDVLLDGEIYYEDYIYDETYPVENKTSFPLKLNENEYFVLGDNREVAQDSRDFGVITPKDIKGKVIYVFRNREI